MKIVVTSDCHGRVDILKRIATREKDAYLYLDAGDSEREERELLPFLSVKESRSFNSESLSDCKSWGCSNFYLPR